MPFEVICVICEICVRLRYEAKTPPENLVVSKKNLIFADKKGDTIMNTIAIKAKGGKPIPADENSKM